MPKIHNIGTRHFRMDPALYGTDGESNMVGLMMHERKIDMRDVPIQANTVYDFFNPITVAEQIVALGYGPLENVSPLLVFGAFARWELENTNADQTEIQMGVAGGTDLIPNNQITAANQETKGFRVFDQGFRLLHNLGMTPHSHWVGPSTAGPSALDLPVRVTVDTINATAGPYAGFIYFYMLYCTVAEVP